MWRMLAIQPSLSSAVGAIQICGPPWYMAQRASGIRFSQQIRPPTRPSGVSATLRSSPAPMPWKTPLLVRRHQLAVLPHEPVGPEQQQRVVERPGTVQLALVDADRAVDAVLSAHAATSRSTSGPGTSTELSHIRSHSSSEPPKRAAW